MFDKNQLMRASSKRVNASEGCVYQLSMKITNVLLAQGW